MGKAERHDRISRTHVLVASLLIVLMMSSTGLAIDSAPLVLPRPDDSENFDFVLLNEDSDNEASVDLAVNVLNYSKNSYGTSGQAGFGILQLRIGVLGDVGRSISYTASKVQGWQQIPWLPGTVFTSLGGSTDEGGEWVDLPFPFIFYGKAYHRVWICINGYICFEESAISIEGEPADSIPDEAFPNAMIAPFWTDLVIPPEGGISYGYIEASSLGPGFPPKDAFIIQWYKLRDITDHLDIFELVLEQDTTKTSVGSAEHGDIYMVYYDVNSELPTGYTPIIGIENQLGKNGKERPIEGLPQSGDVFAFTSTWQSSDQPVKIKVSTEELDPLSLLRQSDVLSGFDWREPLSLGANVVRDLGPPPPGDAGYWICLILGIIGIFLGIFSFGAGLAITSATLAAQVSGAFLAAEITVGLADLIISKGENEYYPSVQYNDCFFTEDTASAEVYSECNSQTEGFYTKSYLQLCGDWLFSETTNGINLQDHALHVVAEFTYKHPTGTPSAPYEYRTKTTDVTIQFLYDTTFPKVDHSSDITDIVRHSGCEYYLGWVIREDHPERAEIRVNGELVQTTSLREAAGSPILTIFYTLSDPGVGTYDVVCTVYDMVGHYTPSTIRVSVLPDTDKPTIENPGNDVEVYAGVAGQIVWQWRDLNPKSYSITAIDPSTSQATPVVTDQHWDGTDIVFTFESGSYVSGTTFRCTANDWYDNSESDDATYTVITLPIDYVIFLNDIPTFASDGSVFYVYSGGPISIRAAILVRCDAYDPNNPVNIVQIGYGDGHWVDASYGGVPFVPPGPGGYYGYAGYLYLYGCNPAATYILKARASTDGGSTWTNSGTITVYVVADLSSWTGITYPTGRTMHFNTISTPYGTGWHVDTIGTNQHGFDFYAYSSPNFLVGSDGKISVSGYFRQYDTFDQSLQEGRRHLRIFVVDANNPSIIIKSVFALQSADGTVWVHKDVIIDGLTPGSVVKIGIGRGDSWYTDWKLTAEWAALSITTSTS